MKPFLISNLKVDKWVEDQEKCWKPRSNVEEISRLFRCELSPQLHMESIKLANQNISVLILDSIMKQILVDPLKRKLHCCLTRECISAYCQVCKGKQKVNLNHTRMQGLKLKSILFYLHVFLGNLDLELMCLVFLINVTTFNNCIKQKMFIGKWIQ